MAAACAWRASKRTRCAAATSCRRTIRRPLHGSCCGSAGGTPIEACQCRPPFAGRILPERLRSALLGLERGSPVARGGHVLGGPGRAVGGDVEQLRRHLRLSVSGLGEGCREPRQRRARPSGRALQRYREMQAFQNSKDRPYIHLVDGGVSDNIGVRGVLEALEELEASAAFRGEVGFGVIRRIVLIVVNARSSPAPTGTGRVAARHRRPAVAGLGRADRPLLVRNRRAHEGPRGDRKWRRELLVARARLAGAHEAQAEASVQKVSLEVLDVSFEAIRDPKERAYFMNLPTSFVLPAETSTACARSLAGCCASRRSTSPSCVSSGAQQRDSAAVPSGSSARPPQSSVR